MYAQAPVLVGRQEPIILDKKEQYKKEETIQKQIKQITELIRQINKLSKQIKKK